MRPHIPILSQSTRGTPERRPAPEVCPSVSLPLLFLDATDALASQLALQKARLVSSIAGVRIEEGNNVRREAGGGGRDSVKNALLALYFTERHQFGQHKKEAKVTRQLRNLHKKANKICEKQQDSFQYVRHKNCGGPKRTPICLNSNV